MRELATVSTGTFAGPWTDTAAAPPMGASADKTEVPIGLTQGRKAMREQGTDFADWHQFGKLILNPAAKKLWANLVFAIAKPRHAFDLHITISPIGRKPLKDGLSAGL